MSDVKKKLHEELESVSEQLHKLKENLDELLQEKILLDEESTSLSSEIKDCRNNENSETNAIERDIRKILLDLETLEEKKKFNQNENELMEVVWGKMKTSFEEALHKSQSENKDSEDLFARLEHIKSEKERIMSEDHELKSSGKKLWETAERIKLETERITVISNKLEEDSKEIDEIFKQINDERVKLIDKDKLLNARYPAIMESLQLVCEQRMDLQLLINENSSKKESENIKDLELAVVQQDIEQEFEEWKKEKEGILKDNCDLDNILESLLAKNQTLKQKRTQIFEKKLSLSKESDEVARNFEKNQTNKEKLVKQFKCEEDKIDFIVQESRESFNLSSSDMQMFSDNFVQFKDKKQELKTKDIKYTEDMSRIKEKYEMLLSRQKQNEIKKQTIDNDEHIQSLTKKSEQIKEQDQNLVNKFEEYEKRIDELTNTKNRLKKEIEDLEWEECFQENL